MDTDLSVCDVDSQVDVAEAPAAYPPNQPVLAADLELLRGPAPAARS